MVKQAGFEVDEHRGCDRAFRAVVVVPTYNNAQTLMDVVGRIERLRLPVIVVNDGSTDHTANLLDSWLSEHDRNRFVVAHPRNSGKAAALRSGFARAQALGFSHVVTIDSDGQLNPDEIPRLLAAAEKSPDALVIGTRDESAPDYPTRSRVGRSVSNFMVHLESGRRVDDSQCGFRVYPLELMRSVHCRSSRYAFETEVLTRAAWAGCPFIEVPVSCQYASEGKRVSHFRPWADSWRGVGMHFPLVVRALVPWPHRRWERAPVLAKSNARSMWKRFMGSLNPAATYRQLRNSQEAGPAMAVALGVGVWIANLPLYPLQTLAGIYTARRLHLNTIGVVVGTQISTPPIGPVLIAAAIALGHLILHGSFPAIHDLNVRALGWRHVLGPMLLDWALGGLILGLILGAVTFFVSLPLLRILRAQRSTDVQDVQPAATCASGALSSR